MDNFLSSSSRRPSSMSSMNFVPRAPYIEDLREKSTILFFIYLIVLFIKHLLLCNFGQQFTIFKKALNID